MTVLPPRLRTWGPELEHLGALGQKVLGRWLPLLDRGIGGRPSKDDHREGEVDGFSGLSRRGPYERLSLHDWGMAEANPEEFLRRAACGELNFLHLRRVERALGRRHVVLFDHGPSTVGAPRLAQLALLLLAASRARAERAELVWGILQEEDIEPRRGLDVERIGAFARPGRSAPATEDRLLDWLSACEVVLDESELWVVGDAALRPSVELFGGRLLAVVEPLLRDEPLLEVRELSLRPVVLPLPRLEDGLSILRDPTGGKRRAPRSQRAPSQAGLQWSFEGGRLFFRGPDGLFVAPVPRRREEVPGLVRRLDSDETPIALGGRGETTYMVFQAQSGALTVRAFERRGRPTWMEPVEADEPPMPPGPDQAPSPLLAVGRRHPRMLLFTDALSRLYRVEWQDGYRAYPVAEHVLCFGRAFSGLWLARATPEANLIVSVARGASSKFEDRTPMPFDPRYLLRPVLAPPEGGGWGSVRFAFVAADGHWRGFRLASHQSRRPDITSPLGFADSGVDPIGGIESGRPSPDTRLVRLDEARRAILLEGGPYPGIEHPLPFVVARASMPLGGEPRVLVEGEEGQRRVLSLPGFELLLELDP